MRRTLTAIGAIGAMSALFVLAGAAGTGAARPTEPDGRRTRPTATLTRTRTATAWSYAYTTLSDTYTSTVQEVAAIEFRMATYTTTEQVYVTETTTSVTTLTIP